MLSITDNSSPELRSKALYILQMSLGQALKERDEVEALLTYEVGDRLEIRDTKQGRKYYVQKVSHLV